METTPNSAPLELDESLRQRIDDLARERGVSPAEAIRQVLDEISHQQTSQSKRASSDSIFELARRISASVPDEDWATLPRDLAANFDHYHYGHPRED